MPGGLPRTLSLRQAEFDDALDILAWRNDSLTRAMSRHDDAIDRNDHLAWYRRALLDSGKLIFVGLHEGRKVGLVRFDRIDPLAWEASIMLAPLARGRKLASPLLAGAIEELRAHCQPERVMADVKLVNVASLRLFSGLGFVPCGEDNGLQHFVLVL